MACDYIIHCRRCIGERSGINAYGTVGERARIKCRKQKQRPLHVYDLPFRFLLFTFRWHTNYASHFRITVCLMDAPTKRLANWLRWKPILFFSFRLRTLPAIHPPYLFLSIHTFITDKLSVVHASERTAERMSNRARQMNSKLKNECKSKQNKLVM